MSWEDYKQEMKARWIFIGIIFAIICVIAIILSLAGVEPPN